MTPGDVPAGGRPGGGDHGERLDRISGQLAELIAGRRMRDWIILGLVAVVAVLALLLGLEHNDRSSDNAAGVAADKRASVNGCLFANRARAADLAEQRNLYRLLVKHHALTPAESGQILALVEKADAPRDCVRLPARP